MKNKISILFVVLVLSLSSCSFMDVKPNYIKDVYVTAKVIDNDTLYAVNGYVQSDFSMQSVSMYNSDKDFNKELEEIQADGLSYRYISNDDDYFDSVKVEGIVYFEVAHDDGQYGLIYDYLYDDVIQPFEILDVTPDTAATADPNTEIIIWDEVEDADYVNITLVKNDTVVYSRLYITGFNKFFKIDDQDAGWLTDFVPEAGDEFEVQMSATLLESGSDILTDVQCISFSNIYTFVWGD